MSVPLLLARTESGKGPKVPLRLAYHVVVVEGLADGGTVVVGTPSYCRVYKGNGRHTLPVPFEKGELVSASLEGTGFVHVRLEN